MENAIDFEIPDVVSAVELIESSFWEYEEYKREEDVLDLVQHLELIGIINIWLAIKFGYKIVPFKEGFGNSFYLFDIFGDKMWNVKRQNSTQIWEYNELKNYLPDFVVKKTTLSLQYAVNLGLKEFSIKMSVDEENRNVWVSTYGECEACFVSPFFDMAILKVIVHFIQHSIQNSIQNK